jgi:cytochrome c oxidase cbb3-type subunit 2
VADGHERVETNITLMVVLILVVVSFGGLVTVLPLFYQSNLLVPVEGVKPYPALALAGRDVYVREGCYVCHSQMIRPFRAETERYGHYSVAGEFVYDRPFQWGSRRAGPDLHRVGGRYSDEWHRVHFVNPRDVVPVSIMPAYPWLAENALDGEVVEARMRALRLLGDPYTDADIEGARSAVEGRTEMDAMIAYLQGLGTAIRSRR